MPSVSGLVTDASGTPLANTPVRLYRRDTGALLGSTPTNASGEYTIPTTYADEVQRIVLAPDGATLYNDIIDRVIPG